jgi:hypothetical protein
MDEAQADVAYQTPEDFADYAGISWFERWQLAQGKKLRKEPEVGKSIADAWDNRNDKSGPHPPKPPPPPRTPPPPPLPPAPPNRMP